MVNKNTLLFGRIFISLVFVVSAVRLLLNFKVSALSLVKMGIPLSEVVLAIGIAVQIVFGLFLILGYKTRLTAMSLIAFLVLANLIYHRDLTNIYNQLQVTKDIAIIGGLLYVYLYGPGETSLDARSAPPPPTRSGKKKKK